MHFVISNAGNVGIGGSQTPGYTLTVNGTSWTTNGAWAGSDRRWKKEIAPLEDSLAKIEKLQGVSFIWRNDEFPDKRFGEGRQIGLIAQDTEAVVPEVVTTDPEGFKGISYEKLVPLLIESIKELKAAKDNMVGSFPLRLDSNRKLLDNVAVIGFYGLPLDYLDTYAAKVEKVSAADIKAAFQRHVLPQHLVTVKVAAD